MEQIWKHVMFLYVVLVLLFHYHLLQVNSEHQTNSSHTGRAKIMSVTNSRVSSRGGGGGGGGGRAGGGGGGGGGLSSGGGGAGGASRGMRGGGTIPLNGGAAGGSAGNNNHHYGQSNGATINCVCFYHCILLFLSIAFIRVSLCN